jgi:putative phosphonate metabolism protein
MTTENPALDAVHRVAAYFAPAPHSLWWQAGSQWLGRCAATGHALDQPQVPGVTPQQLRQLTRAPRRYGWHATLKAPFALGSGVTWSDVHRALQDIARLHARFVLPPLRVRMLGDFLALVPEHDEPAIHHLADACVTGLQPLAAPLSDSELARRRAAGLSAEQDELLQRWGYPHVLAHFRFHLSLTGSLKGQSVAVTSALLTAAQQQFEALPRCPFDAVTLFAEQSAGADLMGLQRVDLAP